jgi:arylsulfatase A-like enzyme
VADTGKPNLLLIVVDQLRADAPGFARGLGAVTPNLDRLAARGVRFTRHFAQGAPCGPGRASLSTGQYVMNHRVIDNETPTAATLKTLPRFMRELGYDPALVGYTTTVPDPRTLHPADPRRSGGAIPGDWDIVRDFEGERLHYLAWLSGRGYPAGHSYDALFAVPGATGRTPFSPSPIAAEHSDTVWCVDGALDYLRIRRDRPWFLHLGIFRPHPPFVATAPYHRQVDPTAIPRPVRAANPEAEAAVHPLVRLLLDTMKATSGLPGLPGLARDIADPDLAAMRAAYLGLIGEVDTQLGRVFTLLEETGQLDRTLIVLTSDHGEQLGDHHLLSKRGYFPQSYHVPCIVVDPRPAADATRGQEVRAFTENIDLLPTLLDWLGQPAPRQCNGHSLLPFLHGDPPRQWRRETHWEYDFADVAGGTAASRLGIARRECNLVVQCSDDYAYVHFAALPPLLFDLQRDPHWLVDLAQAPAHRDTALDQARRLLCWRMSHADFTLATP